MRRKGSLPKTFQWGTFPSHQGKVKIIGHQILKNIEKKHGRFSSYPPGGGGGGCRSLGIWVNFLGIWTFGRRPENFGNFVPEILLKTRFLLRKWVLECVFWQNFLACGELIYETPLNIDSSWSTRPTRHDLTRKLMCWRRKTLPPLSWLWVLMGLKVYNMELVAFNSQGMRSSPLAHFWTLDWLEPGEIWKS